MSKVRYELFLYFSGKVSKSRLNLIHDVGVWLSAHLRAQLHQHADDFPIDADHGALGGAT